MAGAGLVAIKRRIKTITNIRKITNAMNVIATSKLRSCRNRLEINNKYYLMLNEIMQKVVLAHETSNLLETTNHKSNKKLYIVMTSDSGLCGGFNSEVIKKTLEYTKDDRENSVFILVGKKGENYFKRNNLKIKLEFGDISNSPNSKDVSHISDEVFTMYQNGEISEVNIVYTKFISNVKQNVTVKQVLPINKSNHIKVDDISNIDFEPNSKQILLCNIKDYLTQAILNCLLNSITSEQSARFKAMSNATKNADDLLEKLNTKYNRLRQSVITQEISEIVGGAEAQR